nr:DUF3791 domain-containing protein [uncultured Prevotella sp.]
MPEHFAYVNSIKTLNEYCSTRLCYRMILGLHLMSDTYIVNDLIEELRGKQ